MRAAPPWIDLNADLGELPGVDGAAGDAELLKVVTTAHIACGAHAGDGETMRRTVAAALAAGVTVGAHPSYPDRAGFGRRPMDLPPARVREEMLRQVEALERVAALEGAAVRSVKAHGALYNRMAVDAACSEAVAEAVREVGDGLVLVALAGSVGLGAATATGLTTVAEAFCDRGYLADGSLAPRSAPGSLVTEPDAVSRRAVSLVTDGRVDALDGTPVTIECATLCVHGDSPGSAALARAVRRSLLVHSVTVAPIARDGPSTSG